MNKDFSRLREKAGMTQQNLADALKVDRSTVAKWETGTSMPRADRLPQIAAALGCDVAELFGQAG